MILYHSTIQARVLQIQQEGLVPGKKTAMSPAIYQMLGSGMLPNPRCFYAWKTFDKAKDCAYATSTLADDKYQGADRNPIVIEFEISGLFGLLHMRPDPASKPLGVKIRGKVPQIKKIYALEPASH